MGCIPRKEERKINVSHAIESKTDYINVKDKPSEIEKQMEVINDDDDNQREKVPQNTKKSKVNSDTGGKVDSYDKSTDDKKQLSIAETPIRANMKNETHHSKELRKIKTVRQGKIVDQALEEFQIDKNFLVPESKADPYEI